MKIVFILVGNVSRSGPLNGYTIRYGGSSSSGTESSIIYVAEYLSKNNYDVTIALEKCDTPNLTNGVFYTNLNFDGVSNKTYDILVSCLWFGNYNELPIKVNVGLIYWYHLAWGYGYNEIINYVKANNIKLGSVSVSKWAYEHNSSLNNIFAHNGLEVIDTIIPNPVAVDVIEQVLNKNYDRHPHRFIHFGQWSRGGDVALNTIKELNFSDYEFNSFDYIDTKKGLDKKSLFEIAATSEYFIYPQITHGKLIYKDTFSVSIAEAIGLGVIVLTYPLGAVPEYFGDYCQFIDYPSDIDIEKLNTERLSEEPKLCDTENIVKKINWLEKNRELKEEIRNKGITYVSNTFSIDNIGGLWDTYMKRFLL